MAAAAPTLAAELQALQQARLALGRGDGAAAITRLDAMDAEFAAGRLGAEREVLRIDALIAAGRPDEARRRLAALERSSPRSLYLERLRARLP